MSDVKRYSVDSTGRARACKEGTYILASDYDALAAENAALREENERLTAANKARVEYLTTRRAGNDVDSYVNLAETKIEELRAQLAEAQEELAQWQATGESVTRNEHDIAARLAEAERDSQRLDWLERHLFEGKWDGTIGRPKSWHMAGPYRHTLQRMRGDALREAIDLAMRADSATHRENERE